MLERFYNVCANVTAIFQMVQSGRGSSFRSCHQSMRRTSLRCASGARIERQFRRHRSPANEEMCCYASLAFFSSSSIPENSLEASEHFVPHALILSRGSKSYVSLSRTILVALKRFKKE